ncbi:MAG: sugar phosphate nucleotidyltransferase, partial [Candidatus Baldrarchaeia archaeon]
AAGLGTRLLPITKELPKEMLPVFFKERNGRMCLKPMLQAVFEQLYAVGFREFGFIVGRGKRAIEDHFTSDDSFIEQLKNSGKAELANGLQDFYEKINNSNILFINQPKPKGFGDAVYKAKLFTGNESFLMHAGDDLVFSQDNSHLRRIMRLFEHYDADAAFLVEEVGDPRMYGVIKGNEVEPNVFEVEEVIEKPREPPSNLAIIALYVFKPVIYKAIENVKPDVNGEIQLADALQLLLEWKCKLYASKLGSTEHRIDIGTPETYLKAIKNVLEGAS